MTDAPHQKDRYDRQLLLHGAKRNEVLTLAEVSGYGEHSFGDRDYIKVYGLTPSQWYSRGIRLLGRTAVECTRDELADLIGRDIAAIAAKTPSRQKHTVIDPFAGSCNTLFWILRHLTEARGIAFEMDSQVYELSAKNVALLETRIELHNGDYKILLPKLEISDENDIVVFIAPPWGKALDETSGLDLRATSPAITDIIQFLDRTFPTHRLLLGVQVFENVNVTSLTDVQSMLECSRMRVYDLNVAGKNHGLLLGTKRWGP